MVDIVRRSPVQFEQKPAEVAQRGDWNIVLQYADEGSGPHLIDWSHCTKWDVQDSDLSALSPWGASIPDKPGQSQWADGIVINRMNRTQASIWHLATHDLDPLAEAAYTETTDSTACLALTGPHVLSIAEKLCALDLGDPQNATPFLIQGPFSHVPCQIVVAARDDNGGTILLTCSRGYAHDMVHAILDAGKEFGLRVAGEKALLTAVDELFSQTQS